MNKSTFVILNLFFNPRKPGLQIAVSLCTCIKPYICLFFLYVLSNNKYVNVILP